MAVSVWIETRETPSGNKYRLGWRDVVFDQDGKPKNGPRQTGTFVTDPVIIDKQRLAKMEELETVVSGFKPKPKPRTWGDVAASYLRKAGMSIPKSFTHLNKPAVDLFTEFIKESTMAEDITGEDIIRYEGYLRTLHPKNKPGEFYKQNTIRRLLKDLRTCFNWARNYGIIHKTPIFSLPQAQDSERLPTPGEVLKLHESFPPHIQKVLLVLSNTGLRLNELLRLEDTNFRFNVEENYWEMKVRILKRRDDDPTKVKVIPLQPHIVQTLNLPCQPGKVFKMKGWAIENAFSKASQALGIDPVSPHDLRHYWATRYMEETGDIYGLMRYGGWKDFKSVLKYQHLTKGRSRAMLSINFCHPPATQ